MRTKRGISLQVAVLEGRALLSQLAPPVPGVAAEIAGPLNLALNGTLDGTIRNGLTPHTIIVTGTGTLGSLGHVKFSATFTESVGLDTISLTHGKVLLKKGKEALTLAISPATAIVPRNQFQAHFTIISGGMGAGSFKITTFSGSHFVASLHSKGLLPENQTDH